MQSSISDANSPLTKQINQIKKTHIDYSTQEHILTKMHNIKMKSCIKHTYRYIYTMKKTRKKMPFNPP